MVRGRDDVVGLDSSVILPRAVWEASGHVQAFVDPLVECQSCHRRFRADHLEESLRREARARPRARAVRHLLPQLRQPRHLDRAADVQRPDVHPPRRRRGRVRAALPAPGGTAQGIFVNFANVLTSSRRKPPFGIAQIGKSFRNEITPGNFIFRTREFEQMEMEFFVELGTDADWHQYWIDERTRWFTDLGVSADNLRHYEHPAEKRSHYSSRTVDIEYRFGFAGSEWGELEGIANRTDYDLRTHGGGHPALSCPTSTRPRASAGCPTSSSPRSGSPGR